MSDDKKKWKVKIYSDIPDDLKITDDMPGGFEAPEDDVQDDEDLLPVNDNDFDDDDEIYEVDLEYDQEYLDMLFTLADNSLPLTSECRKALEEVTDTDLASVLQAAMIVHDLFGKTSAENIDYMCAATLLLNANNGLDILPEYAPKTIEIVEEFMNFANHETLEGFHEASFEAQHVFFASLTAELEIAVDDAMDPELAEVKPDEDELLDIGSLVEIMTEYGAIDKAMLARAVTHFNFIAQDAGVALSLELDDMGEKAKLFHKPPQAAAPQSRPPKGGPKGPGFH